jgi:LysM repeat protein
MKNKRFLILSAAAAILVLLLVACQMPASTPPPTQESGPETTDTGFPRPEDATDAFEGLELMATQTAMAEAGITPETQPTTAPETGAQPTQPSGEPQVQPTAPPPEAQPTSAPPEVEASVPSPTPGVPTNHTVQAGEFPYCLARRYNVNPSELLSLNGLSRFSTVLVGTTLKMPQTGNPWPGTRALVSHPTTFTVRAGDTIYTIACYFGDVDPVYMAEYNGLKSPYALTAGQTLQIP